MRHKSVRVWWKPWRRRCACGCRWYPCPDAVPYPVPPVVQSLRLHQGLNEGPGWNGPTQRLRNVGPAPLMTPGQRWRTRRNQR